jgi:hypothetical protein
MRKIQCLLTTLVASWAFGFVAVSEARAACAYKCEVDVVNPEADPDLPACAKLSARVSWDCSCELVFEIANECDGPIVAKDFAFEACSVAPSAGEACTELPAMSSGKLEQPLESQGVKQFAYTVEYEGNEHVIEIGANVRDLKEPGCAVSQRRSPGAGVLLGLGLLGLVALRRRAAQRPRR